MIAPFRGAVTTEVGRAIRSMADSKAAGIAAYMTTAPAEVRPRVAADQGRAGFRIRSQTRTRVVVDRARPRRGGRLTADAVAPWARLD